MSDNAQSKNLLLASLERNDYALLRPHLTEMRLEQKVVLQRPGSPITHAYFPLSGMISMLATFPTGEEIEIAAIGREGAVGTRLGRLPEIAFAQGIVQLPGSALRIGIERFREAARNSLGITEIAACANEVMAINLQQSAACNALHKLESRLARWLLHSRDRSDTDRLPLSQEFLSQMLGVRRTTVTLAAHTLQAAGVVSYRRGKIEITDRKGLEAIACDCYVMVKRNIEIVTAPRKSAGTD
ncbi:MAG: Crp/Fnr family transcriptional regulator [Bradyrhizobium sp.]